MLFSKKGAGGRYSLHEFLFWFVKLNVKNKCNFKGRLGLIFTLFKVVLKMGLDERIFSLHYFSMLHICTP